MSVMVNGMKMPAQCVSCKLFCFMQFKGEIKDVCNAIDRLLENPYQRPEWCPLVEAPVVQGEWIPSEDDSKVFGCSKCHEIVFGTPNYCPCCGARMDGE